MGVCRHMDWEKLLKEVGGLVRLIEQAGERGLEINRSGTLGQTGQGKEPAFYDLKVRLGQLAPDRGAGHDRAPGAPRTAGRGLEPAVDVFEEKECLVVIAQLPGIGREEIGIGVDGRLLVLQGGHGDRRFYRRVPLPFEAELSKAVSSFTNGVLELRFPYPEGWKGSKEAGR